MPLITKRIPFSIQNPYRPIRPTTSKIIFLSFEGSVTEEEYFERISDLFADIKSKIQFVSVAEDAVHTAPKSRTTEQAKMLSKVRPKQLVERIEQFKKEKNDIYQFEKYPEDEFWIVADVDKNWEALWINEWNEAIDMCNEKNYKYAISNPFFEIWLLLHHDFITEEDKKWAVTEQHPYEKTNHFKNRLRILGVPLKNEKHIEEKDYTEEKVKLAINRAIELHMDKTDLCPHYLASTVYMILEKILEMLPEEKA